MNLSSLLSIGAAGLSLLLSLWLLVSGFINKGQQDSWQKQQIDLQNKQQELTTLQQEAQQRQQKIQQANQIVTRVNPVLEDMKTVFKQKKNGALRDILIRHGIAVPESTPGGKPAVQ